MARGSKAKSGIDSRQYRATPYPMPPCKKDTCKNICPKKCSKVLDKKEWEDITCSVCMEYPHNAVLLLCSSHDKGCRPYMCGTSYRHSNCLDQYKKAHTKLISNSLCRENEVLNLSCPLCRGQVKGWTIVEPVRDYLNTKKRSCMQDNCMFSGNYKELKKHVRAKHPSACPHAVDPEHEQKWRLLLREREREDVISTVTAAMPGAMVVGDYVIEGQRDIEFEEEADHDAARGRDRYGRVQIAVEAMNFLLQLDSVGQGNNDMNELNDENDRNNEGNDDGVSLISHLGRHGSRRIL